MDLLRRAATPYGFVASVRDITNYQRVWTRDGVITGLAALLSGEESLIKTFRDTLVTLFGHQHPAGFFPSNVDPQTSKASYGGNCGRIDNVSWAVIGLLQYERATGEGELAETWREEVQRAMGVLDAWEFNSKGLVYVPQSGNWADEYVQHGYVLYDRSTAARMGPGTGRQLLPPRRLAGESCCDPATGFRQLLERGVPAGGTVRA